MISSSVRKENELHWFVMRCQSAEKVEAFIDEYNTNALVAPADRVEDLFIPSIAIKRRPVTRTASEDLRFVDRRASDNDVRSNEVRSTLSHFVFLYVRPSAFDRQENHLATQYWNIGHTRLTHYNDGSGQAITICPRKMATFISGCLEYREKFEVRTKASQISNNIQVTVREGAFKDFPAQVYNVHYKSDGVRFSIAIPFFANDGYVHIHDCRPEDVLLADQEMPVFSDDFIDRIQTPLLAILRRRVHKKEDDATRKADNSQLRQLYYLRHAIIDDALRSVQLDALMSICASLGKKRLEKSKYNRIVKQRIQEVRGWDAGLSRQTALAYLLTALYLSTNDADYRTELKQIVRHDLPDHKVLREFLSLVRV